MRTLLQYFCAFILAIPTGAIAANTSLPDWLKLPAGMTVSEVIADERFGEAVIPTAKAPAQTVRGRHWEVTAKFTGIAPDVPGKAIWERWKPVLLQGGWMLVEERHRNPFSVSLRLKNQRDAWVAATFFAADDIRFNLVEVGENRLRMKFPAPGTIPEAVRADGSAFPYLPPPAGANFTHAERKDTPLLVMMREKEGEARIQVAKGSIVKYYRTPKELSNLDFVMAYQEALQANGWSLPREAQGRKLADGLVVAHFGGNGRNVWAVVTIGPGEAAIEVGETGRSELADALKRDCRVTLLGLLFDFDKATLKRESTSVLTRAHEAISASPDLLLEVEGHTDAVGNDTYNQRLSDARAQAVMNWLIQKGVAKGQLKAQGYGKSRPVATNETDEGRAQNRRVELACRK